MDKRELLGSMWEKIADIRDGMSVVEENIYAISDCIDAKKFLEPEAAESVMENLRKIEQASAFCKDNYEELSGEEFSFEEIESLEKSLKEIDVLLANEEEVVSARKFLTLTCADEIAAPYLAEAQETLRGIIGEDDSFTVAGDAERLGKLKAYAEFMKAFGEKRMVNVLDYIPGLRDAFDDELVAAFLDKQLTAVTEETAAEEVVAEAVEDIAEAAEDAVAEAAEAVAEAAEAVEEAAPDVTDAIDDAADEPDITIPVDTDDAADEPDIAIPVDTDDAADEPDVAIPVDSDDDADEPDIAIPVDTDDAADEPDIAIPVDSDDDADEPDIAIPVDTDDAADEPDTVIPVDADEDWQQELTIPVDIPDAGEEPDIPIPADDADPETPDSEPEAVTEEKTETKNEGGFFSRWF